jgi:hypothetical protein
MSVTFEGLRIRSNEAARKMHHLNFSDAVADFTHIVDHLCADNDQRANLKMVAYISRSKCYLELHDYEAANRDASLAISLFTTMRSETDPKKMRRNDPLKSLLHQAYAARGQALEANDRVLDAIADYRLAIEICPRGPAKDLLDSCMLGHEVPAIDVDDPTLKPYSDLVAAISDSQMLTDAFHRIVTHVNSNPVEGPTVERLNKAQIPRLFLGVINFQLGSELCVDIGLTLANYFMKRGGDSVWQNYTVIGKILSEYAGNATIMADCLQLLSSCPKPLYSFFARKEYLDVYLGMFQLELRESDFSSLFALLFHITQNRDGSMEYFKNTNILEYILRWKLVNSLLLLTKLSIVVEVGRAIRQSAATDWCFEFLENKETDPVIIEYVLLTLSNIAQIRDLPMDISWPDGRFASRLFDSLVPVVMAHYKKSEGLVTRALQLFADCVKDAPEKVVEAKVIPLASALLFTNLERVEIVRADIALLSVCEKEGLLPQLMAVKALPTNIVKIMEKYPRDQKLIEQCVTLSLTMGHPDRFRHVLTAKRNFGDSSIIRELAARHDVAEYTREVAALAGICPQ